VKKKRNDSMALTRKESENRNKGWPVEERTKCGVKRKAEETSAIKKKRKAKRKLASERI